MFFDYLAIYINTLAYLLPPFRQIGGKYFPFFLVLAFGNPLALLLAERFHYNPINTICIISFLSLLAVLSTIQVKKYMLLILTLTISLICILIAGNMKLVQIVTIFITLFVLSFFIKQAATYYRDQYSLHLGFFILSLYELGLILKLYLALSNIRFGMAYFYLTDIFEMLIAIFFTIYKVENAPKIKMQRIT